MLKIASQSLTCRRVVCQGELGSHSRVRSKKGSLFAEGEVAYAVWDRVFRQQRQEIT